MNRKGFTLIEILATITILGIVAVVAIPMVTRYLLESKEKTYDTYVTTLYNATREYYEKNSVFLPNVGESPRKVTAQELLDDGFIDDLVDPENKNIKCKYNESFVTVRNKGTKTSDGKVRANADLEFKVTLVCSKKSIKDKVMN